jgi:hypothetical protein
MTESATTVTDAMPIRPTYDELIGSIKHSGAREILAHAKEDERRLHAELERIEADEDLTDEARARMGEEAVERFAPKITSAYASAKEKVTASAETSYLFSLPFPDDKTFAHGDARCKDTTEMLAVQAEAEAITARMGGKSLAEMTRERSRNPRDKGIQGQGNPRVEALREEFDRAMALGGIEGRIKAMAVDRVAESLGMEDFDQIVGHHRTDRHYRALEDHRHATQQAFALPANKQIKNPFDLTRRDGKRIGTYSSGNRAVVTGRGQLFPKRDRKPAWK